MKTLAIESSGELLHITIENNGQFISQTRLNDKSFSEVIMEEVVTLCEKVNLKLKELELVVTARGPGSFTSLRVGYASAKGIAMAANIPLVSLSTLQILAYPLKELRMPILAALDAKKGRYYCALFEGGNRLSDDLDATIEEIVALIAPFKEVLITGVESEALYNKLCDEITKGALSTKIYRDELIYRDLGESMIKLGKKLYLDQGGDPPSKGPTYVRKSDAEVSLEGRI
ncbi:MAG TPA: tRNA (adenosine(37)-N6)-threonylcarbamoyltransferase complex dimerization subunit type 1 TsaB [Spirochaetales bacterium]|nr:tRNA (adenosine(37)-N6)-threonylcarbamoyltransferase complex dimerization subunit type 1 TsaB [Spirochaetales bacterium]